MPWATLAIAAAPIVLNMLGGSGKRNRGSEQPFLDPFMMETLQNRANARTYASWAADPTSEGFRNTAAINEETLRADSLKNIRQFFSEANRRSARGVLSLNPERRDETMANLVANVGRSAHLDAQQRTQQQLLAAANANAAGSSIPPGAFEQYSRYGDANAQARSNMFGGIGELIKIFGGSNAFGSLFGGGGGSGNYWDHNTGWGGFSPTSMAWGIG